MFFWGEEGIFVIAQSQIGDLAVDNISRGKIDKFYQELPVFSKSSCVGLYDFYAGKILWNFGREGSNDNFELILDTSLGSFTLNRISGLLGSTVVKIVSAFTTTPFSTIAADDEVFTTTDLTLVGTDTVVVQSNTVSTGLSTVKYLVSITELGTTKFCFANYRNADFFDWVLVNSLGVDASAYCITGALVIGDSSVRKQIQFLTMHFERTEQGSEDELTNLSSCLIRSQWDWANKPDSLKWSALKQAYRHSKPQGATNFDVVTSRNMLRGQGRAFSLYFETEPRKDCRILGWSISADGNART